MQYMNLHCFPKSRWDTVQDYRFRLKMLTSRQVAGMTVLMGQGAEETERTDMHIPLRHLGIKSQLCADFESDQQHISGLLLCTPLSYYAVQCKYAIALRVQGGQVSSLHGDNPAFRTANTYRSPTTQARAGKCSTQP